MARLSTSFLPTKDIPFATMEAKDDGFDDRGVHRFHYAANSGNLEGMHRELDADVSVDIHTQTESEMTPLLFAATGGQLKSVEWLLDRKANIDASTTNGPTSLIMAVVHDHVQVVDLLLNRKADVTKKIDPNKTFYSGKTAEEIAIMCKSQKTLDRLRVAPAPQAPPAPFPRFVKD